MLDLWVELVELEPKDEIGFPLREEHRVGRVEANKGALPVLLKAIPAGLYRKAIASSTDPELAIAVSR